MAIIPGEQKNGITFGAFQKPSQKKIFFLIILAVILIGSIVYFGFLKKSAEAPSPAGGSSEEANGSSFKLLESLKNINLDSPLFKDKKFQGLNIYGEFPISQGIKGRENPFDPIVR